MEAETESPFQNKVYKWPVDQPFQIIAGRVYPYGSSEEREALMVNLSNIKQ